MIHGFTIGSVSRWQSSIQRALAPFHLRSFALGVLRLLLLELLVGGSLGDNVGEEFKIIDP